MSERPDAPETLDPLDQGALRRFTRAVLTDLRALEVMLRQGMLETGVRRMGAEQELFLVDRGWRPAPISPEVLDRLEDPRFTMELARFNLEINLEPDFVEGGCLGRLEKTLRKDLETVRQAAAPHGDVVLAGILPTLSKSDLNLDNIAPKDRYLAMNEAFTRIRGEPYQLQVEGMDELNVEHDSVMLEACNTSFQIHMQVDPDSFAPYYNAAQLALGPVLAAAGNSPLLFGRRLWAETRIALFQQSIDTRSVNPYLRDSRPRVRFGERWAQGPVTQVFEEDLARFRVLLAGETGEDPFEVLERGGVPDLRALTSYNTTLYRWNRPCYGVTDGKPHLRIECRALPSGPTAVDQVANTAFWLGLVLGIVGTYGDVAERMDFADAKANFLAAARHGLNAGLHWLGGRTLGASELIEADLLRLAHQGLLEAGVDPDEAERYLGIVADRVGASMTGSNWVLRSLAELQGHGTRSERLAALTAAMGRRQRDGDPVHRWPLAELREAGGWKYNYRRVEQYMATHLVTVHQDEPVELVAFLMDRERIRHVPVEDDDHRLVGLVSYRSLLRVMADRAEVDGRGPGNLPPVKEVMERRLATITPETPTLQAIELMRDEEVSCLPVLKDGKLVGLVTERDFMAIAYELLEERLRDE